MIEGTKNLSTVSIPYCSKGRAVGNVNDACIRALYILRRSYGCVLIKWYCWHGVWSNTVVPVILLWHGSTQKKFSCRCVLWAFHVIFHQQQWLKLPGACLIELTSFVVEWMCDRVWVRAHWSPMHVMACRSFTGDSEPGTRCLHRSEGRKGDRQSGEQGSSWKGQQVQGRMKVRVWNEEVTPLW